MTKKEKKSFDISNKMLAAIITLVVCASMLSLLTVDKETRVTIYDSGVRMLTGLTGTNQTIGNVTTTIQSYTYINFTNLTLDWGSGYVTSGYTLCSMVVDTDGSFTKLPMGCGSGGWGSSPTGTGLSIENLGNEDVALNLSTNAPAQTVLGNAPNNAYMIRVASGEGTSCANNTGYQTSQFVTGASNYSNWVNVGGFSSPINFMVCQWFNSSSTNNQINIGVNLTIGASEIPSTTAKVLTITAYGRTCDPVDGTTGTRLNCTAVW